LEILEELGFAAKNSNGNIKITHPKLKIECHVPKCSPYDSKLSPTNGELFVKFPSSQDIQHAGGHCLSAYLAGYVASVDKVAKIHLKGPTRYLPNTFQATHESLHNTKITSVKPYRQKKEQEISKGKKENVKLLLWVAL
jgi:hypothetical protein